MKNKKSGDRTLLLLPRDFSEALIKPAYLTVMHNGVLVQLHQSIMGPTVHRALAKYVPQPAEDSLKLQNHGNQVRYRNVWIRKIRVP